MGSATASEMYTLTSEQRAHFLEHGWIRISKAIPPENLERFAGDVWIRLGYDENDPSTWKQERIHMPRHREMLWKEFTPKAWAAICQLLGGEERIDHTLFDKCGDSLIINLGTEKWRDKTIDPSELDNWHVDGDWFTKFLDSGEQALVTLMLFNDVKNRAGATFICEDGLKHMIKWLYDRPEGNDMVTPDGKKAVEVIKECKKFVELTGEAGDVFLCHPLMPHSASKNHLRVPRAHKDRESRFITNPPVVLKEPFNFNRLNPNDYSLVELKTLRELDVTSLPEWKALGTRNRFTPRTRAGKNARIAEELERMQIHAAKTGSSVDSMHANGIVPYSGDLIGKMV